MTAEIRTRSVDVGDGLSMHVYESGAPGGAHPALLFLHGSGPGVSGRANWEALLGSLGEEFHCLAPDIIGFGDSSHPDPAPQGFKANADLRIDKLFVMLDALGVGRVVLVGNSMGGMYSLRMVQLRPDLVERMVLMGSGGMPNLQPPPGLGKLVRYYDDPSPESMRELLLLFVHDKEAFGPRVDQIAEQRYQVAAREDVKRSHLGTFAPGEFMTFTPEALAEIAQRALVVHGRNDAIVPIESSFYLAEHLPNADLYVLAKCGHWTQIEQATRFTTLLRDFVRGDL